jgi:putative Ca2+/H+ antiporter (TMEM165/GDT1 family)
MDIRKRKRTGLALCIIATLAAVMGGALASNTHSEAYGVIGAYAFVILGAWGMTTFVRARLRQ